jgi:hypothetical protein
VPDADKIKETVSILNQTLNLPSYVEERQIQDIVKKYRQMRGQETSKDAEIASGKLFPSIQTLDAASLKYLNNFILLVYAVLRTESGGPLQDINVRVEDVSKFVSEKLYTQWSSDISTPNNVVLDIIGSNIVMVQNPSPLFTEIIRRQYQESGAPYELRRCITLRTDPNRLQDFMNKLDTVDTDTLKQSDYEHLNDFLYGTTVNEPASGSTPEPVLAGLPAGVPPGVYFKFRNLEVQIPEDWKLLHRIIRNVQK